MNLNGKTYVVMGAAGRIGGRLSQTLISSGANVVAIDLSSESLQNLKQEFDHTGRLLTLRGELTSVDSIQAVLHQGAERFGDIHGSVNAAYPRNANYGRKLMDVTYVDFSENVSLHLGGYFIYMQQCLKYAMERGCDFSLVQFSSIYGTVAPRFEIYGDTAMTMPVEYAAIKAGIQHLMRYATAYAKGTGFRVNCVSPGGILSGQPEEFLARYNQKCRGKGMLEETDLVGAVQFLLSDASMYVCGQNLIVDDGFSN
ncbi:MAG: oxidoreductase [Verrucomicrobiota bacterium]